jgi:hypothetical protein
MQCTKPLYSTPELSYVLGYYNNPSPNFSSPLPALSDPTRLASFALWAYNRVWLSMEHVGPPHTHDRGCLVHLLHPSTRTRWRRSTCIFFTAHRLWLPSIMFEAPMVARSSGDLLRSSRLAQRPRLPPCGLVWHPRRPVSYLVLLYP